MIKDIVVHLSGSEEDEIRLACAEGISERFEAHVTGVFVNLLPQLVGVDSAAMVGMEIWLEEANAQADRTGKRLEERFGRLSMPHDLRRIDVFSGTAGRALAIEARTADLFVATRPYEDPADEVHVEISVLFGSGRACLFLPPKSAKTGNFGTVVVAWNGSREAARALAEAMPLLQHAGQVIVVGVRENEGLQFGGDIARHLSRHGISAVISTVDPTPSGAGGALLEEVRRVGADLLVMGGYGHSRLSEWVMGGATRHVLSHADVPVLMAR